MDMIVNNIKQTSAMKPISARMYSEGQFANESKLVAQNTNQNPSTPIDKKVYGHNDSKADAAVDKKNISKNDIESAIKDIQAQLDFMNTKIAFKVDSKYGEPVVQVIRKDNGEVLRQFPPEQLLEIRAAFRDIAKGVFLNEKA